MKHALTLLAVLALRSPAPLLLCSIASLTAVPAALAVQDKAGAQEQELTQLLQRLYAAILRKDEAVITTTLVEDHPIIQRHGALKTRAQWLAELRSGDTMFTSLTVDDVKVHLTGDTAVVTYRTHLKGKVAGQPVDATSLTTRVFARRANRWRSLAVQYTPVSRS